MTTNRSYRRFYEDHVVSEETLRELVDLTRYCASGHSQAPEEPCRIGYRPAICEAEAGSSDRKVSA